MDSTLFDQDVPENQPCRLLPKIPGGSQASPRNKIEDDETTNQFRVSFLWLCELVNQPFPKNQLFLQCLFLCKAFVIQIEYLAAGRLPSEGMFHCELPE